MKEDLNSASSKGKAHNDDRSALMANRTIGHNEKYGKLDDAVRRDNQEFIEMQQRNQQQMLDDQDQDLEAFSATVSTLGSMAKTINKELEEHAVILDHMDTEVDDVSGRLKQVMRRVDKLLDDAGERVQWCLIVSLVLILIGLVVIVFKV
eukprot:TRINITY_DN577_c0_g1_i2.p1 TRINITY_DN577_c0_g1~~TRINITY_DN577_c0_g1_i2.p1  ORF type:complete len:150 (-),score=40.05 TRINITY_DN577_c0_g1_i2:94-543(-)